MTVFKLVTLQGPQLGWIIDRFSLGGHALWIHFRA